MKNRNKTYFKDNYTLYKVILVCVSFYFFNPLFAQINKDLSFKQLSTDEGLTNASIMVTYPDAYGFIWFGTRSGLNRYNGNEIVTYLHQENQSNSIQSNFIFDIVQLNEDTLLISTETGLEIYQYSSNSFKRYPNPLLQNLRVHRMALDVDGSVWVTSENGLFHLRSNDSKAYYYNPLDSFSISHNYSRSVALDHHHLYVATLNGLNIFDKETNKFENVHNSSLPVYHSSDEISFGISKRSNGEIWFGSYNKEDTVFVNRYNPKTGFLKQYTAGEKGLGNFYSLLSIYEDDDNKLYLGMNGDGLYIFDDSKERFIGFHHDPKNTNTLSDPDVWHITKDKTDNLWVSTDGGGINQYHPAFSRFNSVSNNPFDEKSLGVNDTHDFYEDDEYLWVGNNTLGLSRWDQKQNIFYNYPFTDDEKASLLDFTVYAVEGNKKGNIWIGSYSGGLSRLNTSTNEFTHILNSPNDTASLPSNYIRDIYAREANIWLGTSDGIGKLNTETNQVEIIRRVPKGDTFSDVITQIDFHQNTLWASSTKGLFSYHLHSGKIDSTHTQLDSLESFGVVVDEDHLWVASENGLFRFDLLSKKLIKIGIYNGLSANKVIGIAKDDLANIWCITNNGLNVINTNSLEVTSYFSKDGLLSNQYNMGSIYKGKNGVMYAGGLKGFNYWQPGFEKYQNKPKLTFSAYTLPEGDLTNSHSLINKRTITLNDDDDYLSVHFFSNEIINNTKSTFAYRLREIDKNWVETQDWKIQLTNLSTGKHTLDIKAKSYDGVWGDFSTLKIDVLPPIWATTEAYLLYVIMVISAFSYRNRYLKKQRELLEQTVKDRTHELNESKERIEQDKKIIEKSLTERESLLKEIHHRVKNNLQIIASLLYLQSGKFEDEDFKKVLEEGQGRVRSMALIHQKLYENEDLKSIPFGE